MVLSAQRSQVEAPFHLVVRSGSGSGTSYGVRDGLRIGRHPLNDVCLRDPGVRTHHARIEQDGDQWRVVDVSGEGILCDGRSSAAIAIRLGVRITVGAIEIEFTDGDHVAEPPAAVHSRTITSALPAPGQGIGFEAPTGLPASMLEAVLSAQAKLVEEKTLEGLINRLADWLHDAVPGHHCAVLIRDGAGGFTTRATRHRGGGDKLEPSLSIVDKAAKDRVGVLVIDAPEDARIERGRSIVVQNIRSGLCVPLIIRGDVIGALYSATVGVSAAFEERHLKVVSLVAGPAAGALQSAFFVGHLSENNRDLLRRLAVCARFNDDDTGYHIQRVGAYAAIIAGAMGQSDTYCELLRAAAPMHDIGKIGVPQAILQKKGKLTPDEFDQMKHHTLIGEKILGGSRSPLVQLAAELAGSHHEKWNGAGYPRALAGDAIPLSGRIVAVADVFDALTSARCYKPAFSLEKSYGILREGSGGHFDPKVIDTFFENLARILEVRDHYKNLEEAPA